MSRLNGKLVNPTKLPTGSLFLNGNPVCETTHLLIVFLPKAVLSNSFLLQNQGFISRQFYLLLSTKNHLLQKDFLCFLALLGVVGTCPSTLPNFQNPLLFSTKILLHSLVIPPPLNSSLLACYYIEYGSKDEASPKKKVNP